MVMQKTRLSSNNWTFAQLDGEKNSISAPFAQQSSKLFYALTLASALNKHHTHIVGPPKVYSGISFSQIS